MTRTKLIARDISEGLGKLPPQALDIEESVLGAILIERDALPSVVDILIPEHFYSENHQLIYSACRLLHSQGSPVDMRTVVSQLRKTGHLEIVDGMARIAELTTKASSGANINYHAGILIEHYIKRSIIQLGSDLHTKAYDDTSDGPKLLTTALENLKTLHDTVFSGSGPARIKALWEQTLLTTEPAEPPPLIHLDSTPVAWPGGHSLVSGQKKSRKTLWIVYMIALFLRNHHTSGDEVLLFDTEQSKKHAFKIRQKVHLLTGKYIPVFYLRGKSPEQRRQFVTDTVKYWPTPPRLIVNDGIRDMVNDINDAKEATECVVWLEQITLAQREGQPFPPHVINALHLNKGDGKVRGHLGAELQNKADTVFEVALVDASNTRGPSQVRCEASREEPFETLNFTHNDQGLPTIVTVQGKEIIQDDESRVKLHILFDNRILSYSEVIEEFQAHFACGQVRAKQLLAKFRQDGWVAKDGNDGKKSQYKLLISRIAPPPPPPKKAPNPNLFIESRAPETDKPPF